MVSIKNRLKKLLIIVLCITSVTTSLLSSIPLAYSAGSSSILGTNKALGSPILNKNFTTNNWNKWEMICWGVFLSNFCQPLIDTYQTAFSKGNGGSNGAGYAALCFGSGSDPANNETIRDLLDYAVNTQLQNNLDGIFVCYTHMKDGVLEAKTIPSESGAGLRPATFNDFFYSNTLAENTTSYVKAIYNESITSTGQTSYDGNTVVGFSDGAYSNYTSQFIDVDEAYIPTFYIKSGSDRYVEILDYTNPWDIQVMGAMINSLRNSEVNGKTLKDSFKEAFTSYEASNPQVGMDCFGNIVLSDRKILVPASVNRNITKEKDINILNSWMMNSYISPVTSDKIVQGLHQTNSSGFSGFWESLKNFDGDVEYSGMPAFGESSIGSVGLFYYDTDTIVRQSFAIGSSANYGYALSELYNQDITSNSNKFTLKFEIAGNGIDWVTDVDSDRLNNTVLASSIFSNILKSDYSPEILHELTTVSGEKQTLFSSDPVIVSPQVLQDKDDKGLKNAAALRSYYNWLYQTHQGKYNNTTFGILSKNDINSVLSNVESVDDLKNKTEESLWKFFTAVFPEYEKSNVSNMFSVLDFGGNETISSECSRQCLVYPVSDVMKSVSQILGVADGTEFSSYSTIVYMTYLEWYGVINKNTISTGTTPQSDFSTEVYSDTNAVLNVDIGEITEVKSPEELEEEALQLSYLMLHPEEGRNYRKQLMYNGIADFIYEEYNRAVFGGYDNVYTGTSTKANNGFLSIPTFSENPLTSWIIDNYVDIAVILIMGGIVIVIIVGLLKGRKITWFLLNILLIVFVVLLAPSSGEITPYITSTVVQKMYNNKMTTWQINEGVANATIESDANTLTNNYEGLSSEEAAIVNSLVNYLSVQYTDRSLMLKQDISQKITQEAKGLYADIQSIQSARWILPMVMQQFSADEQHKYEYIYVKMSNVWDDGSNLYWYYRPDDARFTTSSTLTSEKFLGGSASTVETETANSSNGQGLKHEGLTQCYGDWVSVKNWLDDPTTNVNYRNYSYTLYNDEADIIHSYAYILHNHTLGMNNGEIKRSAVFGQNNKDYTGVDSWKKWVDVVNTKLSTSPEIKGAWSTTNTGNYGYEKLCTSYDRTDPSTLKDGYSYFKTTESYYYYFFNVVKDSFPYQKHAGSVIGRLQGEIKESTNGNEVRANFMYATKTASKEQENETTGKITNTDVVYTGHVRDVLDLECFFTNMLPYMYEMTIAAGGFDGESGILAQRDAEGNVVSPMYMSDNAGIYEGTLQSWAYRCNWAVKLMENPNYSKPLTVRDKNNKKYTITNPLLPDSYPSERPMVFSEAQMYAMELEESDLNLVELKCIEVNKQVAKSWTMLVNYAGTDGLTKEVIFRVMATDATSIFSQVFSSGGLLDNKYNLHPQSVDLRYLSFDAVMKMIMMNVSKNTSYAYGDTMATVIEQSDLLTAVMLLLCAWICVDVLPLLQQFILAFIFIMGFLSIIGGLFKDGKTKSKIAFGQVFNNLIFMVASIVYYWLINSIMSITSTDAVLHESKVEMNLGNPIWALIFVLLVSVAYGAFIIFQVIELYKHHKDMGFEMLSMGLSTMVNSFGTSLSKVTDGMYEYLDNFGGESSSRGSRSGAYNIQGTGMSSEKPQDVNITQASDSVVSITNDNTSTKLTSSNIDESSTSSYATDNMSREASSMTSDDIDAEIEAGSKIEDK